MLLKGAYCVGEHFVDPHSHFLSKSEMQFEWRFPSGPRMYPGLDRSVLRQIL